MANIVLAGNRITARIIYDYLRHDQRYNVLGCVVDDAFVINSDLPQLPSVGISELGQRFPADFCRIIMAMGYNQVNAIRAAMFSRLKKMGYAMETWIHPQAMIHTEQPIGEGSCIFPGALVEPGAKVGSDCLIWGNVVVAHDAIVENDCWLAAGAIISGQAHIGEGSFIGVNATVANKVKVGEGSIIGGAAFISKNVKPDSAYLARSAEPFRCTAKEYALYFGI